MDTLAQIQSGIINRQKIQADITRATIANTKTQEEIANLREDTELKRSKGELNSAQAAETRQLLKEKEDKLKAEAEELKAEAEKHKAEVPKIEAQEAEIIAKRIKTEKETGLLEETADDKKRAAALSIATKNISNILKKYGGAAISLGDLSTLTLGVDKGYSELRELARDPESDRYREAQTDLRNLHRDYYTARAPRGKMLVKELEADPKMLDTLLKALAEAPTTVLYEDDNGVVLRLKRVEGRPELVQIVEVF